MSAKKQVCSTVLIRVPSPASSATRYPSTTKNRRPLSTIACCTSAGSLSQISSGPYGLLSRNVAPGRATPSTSSFSRRSNWWHATKSARFTR